MAWKAPSEDHPVWCSVTDAKVGVPTAQSVRCVTQDPTGSGPAEAALDMPPAPGSSATPAGGTVIPASLTYTRFTSQKALGDFLIDQYHIRPPQQLSSCETCHR